MFGSIFVLERSKAPWEICKVMFNQLIMNHSDLLGDLGDLVDVGGRSDLVDLGDLGVES